MKFIQHISTEKAVGLVLLIIGLVVFGSVVLALVFPITTTDYEFLRTPTLTP